MTSFSQDFIECHSTVELKEKKIDRIMAVEKLKLNDGYEMPCYGLGTMFVSSSNKICWHKM